MAAVEVGQEDEVQLCVECGGRGVAFVDGWAAWTDDEQPVECPVCIENLICPQCGGSMVNVCDGCGKEPEWCECDDPEYSNYEKDLRCLVCGLVVGIRKRCRHRSWRWRRAMTSFGFEIDPEEAEKARAWLAKPSPSIAYPAWMLLVRSTNSDTEGNDVSNSVKAG